MRKRNFISFLFVLGLLAGISFAQTSQHFYNVDSEKRVEGTIQEIIMEPRYKDRAPFLVLKLEEKGTHDLYNIEVSPAWFFEHDFHKGEDLTVVGSFYTTDGKKMNIIAREVRLRGETLVLRDKHGFPNWRGGQSGTKGRRRGKGVKKF
ncbi:MAG: hypothetical protein PVH84_06935 [Candidatus Aminicenantes bacterium]|jgi:hypothetical protein